MFKHTFAAATLLLSPVVQAHDYDSRFRGDLNGKSFHADDTYSNGTKTYNENNRGVGIAYSFNQYIEVNAGSFVNSFHDRSNYFGGNLGIPFQVTRYLSIRPGIQFGGVSGYESITPDAVLINDTITPVALPSVSFDIADRFQLNVEYIPGGITAKSSVYILRAGIWF